MAVSAMPQSQLRSVGIENRDAAISQVTGLAPPSPESMDDETMHAMDSIINNHFTKRLQDYPSHGRGCGQHWSSLAQYPLPPVQTKFPFEHTHQSLVGVPASAGDEMLSNASISPRVLQFDTSPLERASPTNTSTTSRSSSGQYKPLAIKTGTSKQTHRKTSSVEAAAASDRSERARNAANRRHSRAKEAATASASDEYRSRQDIEREKNRVAAAKCRKKKRVVTDALDAEYRAASAANSRMKREHLQLRDELTFWRMLALQHVNGRNGCQCQAVERYNNDQAFRAVYNMEGNESVSSMDPSQVGGQDTLAIAA